MSARPGDGIGLKHPQGRHSLTSGLPTRSTCSSFEIPLCHPWRGTSHPDDDMTGRQGWENLHALELTRANGTPLFRQLYLQLRSAILSRRLRPGTKLPSTRQLAAQIGVSRSAVVAAYEQLLAEGYTSGKHGSGTYVSPDLPEPIDGKPQRRGKPAAATTPAAAPLQPIGD